MAVVVIAPAPSLALWVSGSSVFYFLEISEMLVTRLARF